MFVSFQIGIKPQGEITLYAGQIGQELKKNIYIYIVLGFFFHFM